MTASLVVVGAPITGLRVSSCCSSWPPHRLSLIRPLLHKCSRCRSLPVGFSSLPSPKQYAPRTWGSDLKNKIVAESEFNASLPRPSTLCLPPPSSSNPVSYWHNRLCRSVARDGSCLGARTSRLGKAALPQQLKNDAQIVGLRA